MILKRALNFLTLAIIILGMANPSYGFAQDKIKSGFTFVYSAPNKKFVTGLVKRLSVVLPTQSILAVDSMSLANIKESSILVTTGKKSLADVLSSPHYRQRKIVSTLISSIDYRHEINKYPSDQLNITAIYSDPSLAYQIQLSAMLMDKPQIAFIYDADSQYLIEEITAYAQDNKLPKPIFIENDEKNINGILKRRDLADADILLASPLRSVYNRRNTKNIIFTLLSRNQALVGYSSGWVSSGALATVYSNKNHIIDSIADLLGVIALSERNQGEGGDAHELTLPKPRHPNHIDVKLNKNIAKLLGVDSLTEASLANSLRDKVSINAQ